MASPQVEVEISTALLMRAVQEIVPTLLPCQNPQPDAKEEGNEYFYQTALEVTEVVPLRADDLEVRDASGARADKALIALGAELGFPTTVTRIVLTPPGTPPIILADQPHTFLLASCTFNSLSSNQLHDAGRSDLNLALDLHRHPPDQAGGALLFAVDVLNLFPANNIGLHLRLLGLFNSGVTQDPFLRGLIAGLAAQVGDHVIPLGPDDLFSSLGKTAGPTNVGLSALAWTGTASLPVPPKVGLRLGVDLEPSTDADGWSRFWQGKPGLIDDILGPPVQDIRVAVDASYSKGLIEKSVAAELGRHQLPGGLSIGLPTVTFDPPHIELRVPVWFGFLGVGDAVATVAMTSRSDTLPRTNLAVSFIDATVCVRVERNVGTEILLFLLALLTGGLLFALISPVLVITGALLGAVVELIEVGSLSNAGAEAERSGLSSVAAGPLITCGELDKATDCRTCSISASTQTPFGPLLLTNLTLTPRGVAMAWTLSATAKPAAAKLNVTTSGWGYPMVACKAVDRKPVKTVLIHNEGGLPLKVCSFTQYVTAGATAKVLEVLHSSASGPGPMAMVPPGGSLSVSVTAHVDDPSYDQALPPPLLVRVLTSAGYRELDLNRSDQAQLQSEAANQAASARSAILCDGLTSSVHQSSWHQLTFTDPVPFTTADLVHERVDIRTMSSNDRGIEARDYAGRLLGQGYASAGVLSLSTADSRAPASEHTHPQISVITTALSRIGVAAEVGDGSNAISRSLYRHSATTSVPAVIVGVVQFGDRLAVLTDRNLRVARVTPGAIGPWTALPAQGGTAIASLNDMIAVGSSCQLDLLNASLELVASRAIHCQALASAGGLLWSADAEGVRTLALIDSELAEQSLTRLPDVTELVAAGATVLALSNGQAWLLNGRNATPLATPAQHLASYAGRGAAVHNDGLTVFGDEGQIAAEYLDSPWLGALLEWDNVAIELKPQQGVLLVHDRYETTLDPEHLDMRE